MRTVYARPIADAVPRYDQLVLPFGLGIAVATLIYWTLWEFQHYDGFVGEGVVRAALAMAAIGVLALVLRLARATERHVQRRRTGDV